MKRGRGVSSALLAVLGVGLLMVPLGPSAVAASSTIVVTTTADDLAHNGNCTLREALLAADTDHAVDACHGGSGPDTIVLSAGTYTLTLGELTVNSTASLLGVGAATFIDGGGASLGLRAIHVMSHGHLSISKLTVRHAASAFRNDGTLSLSHVNVVANGANGESVDPAVIGASGIDNHGAATVANSLFANNSDLIGNGVEQPVLTNAAGGTLNVGFTTFKGTGLSVFHDDVFVQNDGTLNVSNTVFDGALDSSAYDGGTVVNSTGTLILTKVTIKNTFSGSGGSAIANSGHATIDLVVINNNEGVGVRNAGTASVVDTTISNNSATAAGGIVNAQGAKLQLANSTVSGNASFQATDGGITNRGTAILVNDTIAANASNADSEGQGSPTGGGGIGNYANLTLRNVTITGNTLGNSVGSVTPNEAGGLYNDSGATVRIANSIIAGNIAGGSYSVPQDCNGTLTGLGYNLIQQPVGCTIAGTLTGDITGKSPRLGPLANDGGPTLTEMPLSGSPVIDKANPAAPGTAVALCALFDQRGVARPRDGNGDHIKRCDIGAVEK
jgi:CSLREA domain-containing protein